MGKFFNKPYAGQAYEQCFGSGLNQVNSPYPESGATRAKMAHKNKFNVMKSWMFPFEG
jgi:hypothetical protein